MKRIKLILLLAIFGLSVSAQTIIVQKADGSNARVFNNIDDAVKQANANDYLYFSGGKYDIKSGWRGYTGTESLKSNFLVIDKPLHFVGGGYKGGSDAAVITGTFALRRAASGSTITGMTFENAVYLDSISNTTVSRNLFKSHLGLCGTGTNNVITECQFSLTSIYGTLSLGGGSSTNMNNYPSTTISKNIIYQVSNLQNVTIANNVIQSIIAYLSYCEVKNNIFIHSSLNYSPLTNDPYTTYNTFENNIMYTVGYAYNNTGKNNIALATLNAGKNVEDYIDITGVFVNYKGSDYHLKPEFLSICTGTDGTQIGIYGTTAPFKENKTTAYPQFLSKNIAEETNGNGELEVEMKVEAQVR